MPKLTAVGADPTQRRQIEFREGQTVRLGAAPSAGWDIPWELKISREHADLTCTSGQLWVTLLESARNACIVDGRPTRRFTLSIGENFRIGATQFDWIAGGIDVESTEGVSVLEQAYDAVDLHKFKFDNAADRLELLAGLPKMIADSRSDVDLSARLVDLLIEAIPLADAAAVVVMPDVAAAGDGAVADTAGADTLTGEAGSGTADPSSPATIRWTSRRDIGPFRPSRQLILAALARGQSLLHIWTAETSITFTRSADLDWAFCTPIGGEACRGWTLYVSGKFQLTKGLSDDVLKGHIRFTELLAQFISAIRQVRTLEQRQATMSRFFSPAVVGRIAGANFEAELDPKEGPITVMFCDLRGFSQQAERSRNQLREFLSRVSEALGVMTRSVLAEQGVIADFQGDAILAFWGWPTPLADGPLAACRAALAIREKFAAAACQADSLLAGFDVGIGIAHGPAIAGKLGTDEQIKIGVFGPVVNLASRLQSLTQQLGVTIVIDPTTAECAGSRLPSALGRLRKLAKLRPKGLADGVLVSELLPAESAAALSNQQIELHEAAVAAFLRGDWAVAKDLLASQPAGDGARAFLLGYLAQHGSVPPPGWDGVISLREK